MPVAGCPERHGDNPAIQSMAHSLPLGIDVIAGNDDMTPGLIHAHAVEFTYQPADFMRAFSADALDGAAFEHPAADKRHCYIAIGADVISFGVGGDFMNGHQISSQESVKTSLGVMPPDAEVPTVSIITQ